MTHNSDKKKKEEYDGINVENLMTLERLKQNQRKDYLKVSCFDSTPIVSLSQTVAYMI